MRIKIAAALVTAAMLLLSGCGSAAVPDGTADTAETTAAEILLSGGNAPAYTIIRGDNARKGELNAVRLVRDRLRECGMEMKISTDWEGNPVSAYEIVIGDTLRDEGETDETVHADILSLRSEEYLVRVCGSRIYIAGGSDESLLQAAEHFLSGFFSDPGVGKVSLPREYSFIKRKEYPIRALTVSGRSLQEFCLVRDAFLDQETADILAQQIGDYLYENAGFRPQNAGLRPEYDNAGGGEMPAVILSGKTSGRKGTFSVSVQNGNLVLSTDTPDGFIMGWNRFRDAFLAGGGEINLEKSLQFEVNLMETESVSYADFGAKGDGVTDDLAAIIAAHAYANKHGLPVRAGEGKTFYIGLADAGAVIGTSTDFTGAHIIIDDREVPMNRRKVAIFTVAPSGKTYEIPALKTLKKGQTNIGMTLPEDAVVILTEAGTKRYIRRGYNADNDGVDQNEVLIVRKNGDIDSSTPVIWDYTNITGAQATPIDETPLTIRGGTFTTIVCNDIPVTGYYKRGFLIRRSNVTVEGITHLIENEGKNGAPYQSFMDMQDCADVTLKDCVFTPHLVYYWMKNGVRTSVGTYDLSPVRVANLTLKNCTQTIDILDQKYWGIICTNFCKNLTLDGCSLSRIDAHQGVYTATVLNSELGWLGMDMTGAGTLYVENSTMHGTTMLKLRDDYGSTWDGDVIVKNCTWAPNRGKWLSEPYYSIIGGTNLQQHDFGYPSVMPHSITLENLRIDDSKATTAYKGIALFADLNPNRTSEAYEASAAYPYTVTEKVTIRGLTIVSGREWIVSTNPFMFRNVRIDVSDR